MRVLFCVVPGRPHLYPLVPLAWACRAAGHEVRIAGPESLLDDIVHTGLPAVLTGGYPPWTPAEGEELITTVYTQGPWPNDWAADLSALSEDQLAYLEFLGRAMVRCSEVVVGDLIAFAGEWRPELIVYDAASYAGAVAAAVLDVPGVRQLFGSASLPRLELLASGEPLPEYARMFERFGVRPRTTSAATIDPTPPSMRVASDPGHISMRYVPHNGPGVVPAWWHEPKRAQRVCVTWGHTSPKSLGAVATQPYRDAIDAMSELGVEIIVVSTAEQIELLGPLPPGARTAPSTPLNLILPQSDLLVQQGGDGTTLAAAWFGIPQLAISRKPDAELAPGRLAAVGAGIHLRYQQLPEGADGRSVIRSAVRELLADRSYRDAAAELGKEIQRQPAPAEIVPILEALAGSRADVAALRGA